MASNPFKKKMSAKAMAQLMKSISYMLEAGLRPSDGIDTLLEEADRKVNTYGLKILQRGQQDGLSLSEIFKEHEDVFGFGIWRQIYAAESSGKLKESCLRISLQFEQSGNIQGKIKSALAYPILLGVVALFAGYYMFTTSIPEMAAMLKEFDAELPAITLAVMAFADYLINNLVVVVAGMVLVITGVKWVLTHPLRLQFDKFVAKLPVIGDVSSNMNFSVVYLLITDMLSCGSSLNGAMRVAASAAKNVFIKLQLDHAVDAMEREGLSIEDALLLTSVVPSEDRMMLSVGRRSGKTIELLVDMAKKRHQEAISSTDVLLELMTPMIMILVSGVIGVMIISIYMPMLTISSAIK